MKSLTDVVSGAGLSGYAEIALVIFFVAFVGVVISLYLPSKQRTYERLRNLPMDDEAPALVALCRDDEGPSLRSGRQASLRSGGQNDA
jgi:cbb3-type cytochrome oxidase subunit 3